MGLYEVLKKQAAHLDEASFRKRYGGYYLLGFFREFDSALLGFNTGKLPAMPDLEASGATELRPRLWRLEKSDRNTWRNHISVGRAKNNDVVIRQHSISKLHAHFHALDADTRTICLVDIGSENGTVVNGERLPTDLPRDVKAGDEIVLGGTDMKLLDVNLLLELLT